MGEIEKKVCDYGQKRNITALQAYIAKIDSNELVPIIKDRIRSQVFTTFWNYLLQSFTNSAECQRKRFKIASTVLQELEKSELSTSQCTNILSILCGELPKFKPAHLINLASFCVEVIQKGNVTQMCWKDLLPDILNVLAECECVNYNDTDMTGLEYKSQLINSLCMLTWSPNIIISLATMFIDVPLTKEEHLKVVNKLGQYMEKLTCQEIPSFVYQLLKLCHKQNSQSVFLRLQYYFSIRIYNKINLQQDSDSMDIIGDSSDQESIDVESTVLFHIYRNALQGHDLIKDYLSSLKNLQKSPEFILHPFQFTVLLTISSLKHYEDSVMEILKSCISRALNEEHRKCESYWFREMVPSTAKIDDVVKQIIEYSIPNRDLVIKGLVQLSYVLLSYTPMLGKDADRQWNLGKLILLKIIKNKSDIVPCIIKSLGNFIVTGQNPYQFIDCIYIVCHKMPFVILEHQSCIISLLDYLDALPGPVAKFLFDAILPLAKLSPTIRDHMILLLKKALYSRTMDKRQLAATGFVRLIRNLKINNLAALSQSSSCSSFSSGLSVFTQVSMTCTGRTTSSAFSNEALCMEVLDILKRCFMLQAEVRAEFYDGLYNAICMNPELSIPALDLIWNHFSGFYVKNENDLPPLKFSKICVTQDITVTLQEPLGKMVYTIGLMVTKVNEDNSNNPTVIRFKDALESLCSRMINCELINFELDDGTDLLNNLPESQEKLFILREALSVYDALIGYKICSWNLESQNNAQQINSLFQSYSRLVTFSKNLSKPKKIDKKKKDADQNKTTQQSQNATRSDGASKSAKLVAMPITVMDFQTLGRMLQLLHKTNVDWAPSAQTNIIKTKGEIHQYVMQATIQLVQELKHKKTVKIQHSKVYYNFTVEIAEIIYNRCIVRLNDFIDFDSTTGILAMECFYGVLTVISLHYRNQMPSFLKVIVGEEKDIVDLLLIIFKVYEKIFEDDNETGVDTDIKKVSLVALNTLNLLVQFIPTTNNALSVHVLEWLKTYMNNNTLSNKPICSAFITLTLNTHIKFKSSEKLFETFALRLSEVLGTLNKESPNANEPKIINDASAPFVFQMLCNSMKSMLDDVDWIISRLRAEYAMITYPGEENPERRREYLKGKEKCVCSRLCPIISITSILTNITIPPGNLSEALLKIVAHLYNTLNILTKYFMLRSSKINLAFQGALFERVVKMCGKQLSNMVYDFILYIEESNKEETSKKEKNKKKVDTSTLKTKVLKETRLIPKVIYEIEQFGKSVIQLSNKTNVNLSKFVGQGTARDFRIKGLKDVLKMTDETIRTQNNDTSVEEDEEGDKTDADIPDSVDEVQANDNHDAGPSRKKLKK